VRNIIIRNIIISSKVNSWCGALTTVSPDSRGVPPFVGDEEALSTEWKFSSSDTKAKSVASDEEKTFSGKGFFVQPTFERGARFSSASRAPCLIAMRLAGIVHHSKKKVT
jgi:hypothetical protein